MKTLYRIIVCLLIIATTQKINAQNQDSQYTLHSDSVTAFGLNRTINSIIIVGENDVNWSQTTEIGVESTVFNITGITGDWNESTSIGQITYALNIIEGEDEYLATLIVTGTPSGFTAELICIVLETQQDEYLFSINGISYQ